MIANIIAKVTDFMFKNIFLLLCRIFSYTMLAQAPSFYIQRWKFGAMLVSVIGSQLQNCSEYIYTYIFFSGPTISTVLPMSLYEFMY